MSSRIRNFFKKFLPSSAKANEQYANKIIQQLDSLEKRFNMQSDYDKKLDEKLDSLIQDAEKFNAQLIDNGKTIEKELQIIGETSTTIKTELDETNENLSNRIAETNETITKRLDLFQKSTCELDSKLRENNLVLVKELDMLHRSDQEIQTALSENTDSISAKLGEHATEITERLDRKLSESNSEIVKELGLLHRSDQEIQTALSENTDSISAKLGEHATEITERLDSLNQNANTLDIKLSESNSEIVKELGLLHRSDREIQTAISKNIDLINDKIVEHHNKIQEKLYTIDYATKSFFEEIVITEKKLLAGLTEYSEVSQKLKMENETTIIKLLEKLEMLEKKTNVLSSQATDSFSQIKQSFREINDITLKILNSTTDAQNSVITSYEACRKGLKQSLDETSENLLQNQNSIQQITFKKLESIHKTTQDSARNASEAVWAQIFNNTINKSSWLKDKNFSPGRWAVGYDNLYVTYRILNEIKPKKILELGLGQSTKMLSQYANFEKDVEHTVIEYDPNWISFFKKNFNPRPKSRIIQFDYELCDYNDCSGVRIFKGLSDFMRKEKFDFITVDAPWSGDQTQYARIDLLFALPDCLSENFIILFDDCDRIPEINTVTAMEEKLKEFNIQYAKGRYRGKKDCILICANHLKFLTSM